MLSNLTVLINKQQCQSQLPWVEWLPSKAGHTKAVKHLYSDAQHLHGAHTAPTPCWDRAAVPHAVTRHSYKHTSL